MSHTAPKILAVDDMPQIAVLLKDALATAGYEVDTALDGYEALNMAGMCRYDLVITDIIMPGMCGKNLYNDFIKLYPYLAGRIIFSTGDTGREDTARFIKSTGCPYLLKPFTIKELIETVNGILRG